MAHVGPPRDPLGTTGWPARAIQPYSDLSASGGSTQMQRIAGRANSTKEAIISTAATDRTVPGSSGDAVPRRSPPPRSTLPQVLDQSLRMEADLFRRAPPSLVHQCRSFELMGSKDAVPPG